MNEINYLNDSHKSVVEKYLLRLMIITFWVKTKPPNRTQRFS